MALNAYVLFRQTELTHESIQPIKKPQAHVSALRLACCEQTRLPGDRRTTPFNKIDEATHATHGGKHHVGKHSARLL